MKLRFWGTRGSIPQAGYSTLRYGGNTACVILRSASGTCVVLDCGTGAHGLGRSMVRDAAAPEHGHLLITHTHWDHIQGFPFFAPLFTGAGSWDVYGPRGIGQSLKDSLVGQLRYTYFPVLLEDPASTNRYHELVEGRFAVGDIRVTTRFLNHPALTLGYRLEVDGVVVVYATDHEPHDRRYGMGIEGDLTGEDLRHAQFIAGADLLIHDAQYTAAEYPERLGWGHSTIEYAVDMALRAGVRELALFHHDPWRTDDELDAIVVQARQRVVNAGGALEVFAAAEGRVIEMGRRWLPTSRLPQATLDEEPQAEVTHAVLVATAEAATAEVMAAAVRAIGLQLLTAGDADLAVVAAAAEPALILLDRALPGGDVLALCRRLREGTQGQRSLLPIVLIADQASEEDRRQAEAAGVTDWLVRPFSPAYARSRITAWVLRQGAAWLSAHRPNNEPRRLATLHGLRILDTGPEERFDRLTRMAGRLLNMPISALSLVDADRQWFKSVQGLDASQGPREASFCAHAILGDEPMVVPDAFLDQRFADNPAVTGEPFVRFYAGVPVHAPDGCAIGSFCVIDHRPRELDARDLQLLKDLAGLVEEELRKGVDGAAETTAQSVLPRRP
ncbi:MAG: GAF domain-containing protein [Ardenticatenia bacterium]|nr:GAF domain-containing protein [Ardenticatenia bacterium]